VRRSTCCQWWWWVGERKPWVDIAQSGSQLEARWSSRMLVGSSYGRLSGFYYLVYIFVDSHVILEEFGWVVYQVFVWDSNLFLLLSVPRINLALGQDYFVFLITYCKLDSWSRKICWVWVNTILWENLLFPLMFILVYMFSSTWDRR